LLIVEWAVGSEWAIINHQASSLKKRESSSSFIIIIILSATGYESWLILA
jgi:hypothetical protein